MENEQRREGLNTSVMLWRAHSLREVHDNLRAHFEVISKYICKFDHWMEVRCPAPLPHQPTF
jgi:hypothetical protein